MTRRLKAPVVGAVLAACLGAGALGLSTAASAHDFPDEPVVTHPAPGVGLIPPAVWERNADGTVTRIK